MATANIQTAGAHGQHTDSAARRRMAVRTDQRLSRFAESLKMNLMAYAVSRTGKVQPVFLCHRLNKPVVVGIFKAGLQGVVIDIATDSSVLTRGIPIVSNSR